MIKKTISLHSEKRERETRLCTNLAYLAGYAFSTGGALVNPFLRAFMMQLRSSLDIIVSFNAARGKAWGGSTADFSPPFLILCLLSFAFLRFFSSPILLRALTRSLAALSSPAATVEIGSSPRYRSVRKCRNLLSEWESRLWDRRAGLFFFFFEYIEMAWRFEKKDGGGGE